MFDVASEMFDVDSEVFGVDSEMFGLDSEVFEAACAILFAKGCKHSQSLNAKLIPHDALETIAARSKVPINETDSQLLPSQLFRKYTNSLRLA
ncbi:hypothetical protein PM082_018511 [Marasmius tenuissimus]|nr:hypothetical protein PM082_018511 [Marasmius tenuissimus]